MLRTNLATRPFYNERAVRAVLGVCAAILLALTVYNVLRYVSLSGSERELSVRATEAGAEAERLRAEAVRIRSQIDPEELETVSAAAREVNDLIQQRKFSWVHLLTELEAALPANVRVTSINPRIDKGAITIAMDVEARSNESLANFMEALEKQRSFRNVLPGDISDADDGIIDASVEGIYVPPDEAAAAGPGETESTGGHE